MPRICTRVCPSICKVLFVALAPWAAAASVVVESTRAGFAADIAGLREGSQIEAWRAGERHGDIDSAFALWQVAIEFSPIGPVQFEGLEEGQPRTWSLPASTPWGPLWKTWGVRVHPKLEGNAQADYQAGLLKHRAGDLAGAISLWKATVSSVPDDSVRAWFWLTIAGAQRERRDWPSAQASFERAEASALRSSDTVTLAMIQSRWASLWSARNDLAQAQTLLTKAVDNLSDGDTDYPALIDHLRYMLGLVVNNRGELEASKELFEAVQTSRIDRDRESLAVAETWNELASVAKELGNLEEGQALAEQALAILEKKEPGGLAEGKTHNTLGRIALERSDLLAAEAAFTRSAEIHGRLMPLSRDLAAVNGNLGIIAIRRGDYAAADLRMSAVLESFEKTEPGGSGMIQALNNLGFIALRRSELELAEKRYARSLELAQKRTPDGPGVASALTGISAVLSIRGNLAEAERMRYKAVEIRQRQAPGSLDLARAWINLGEVTHRRGGFAAAEAHYSQALKIIREKAPGTLREAVVLNNLAQLALREEDYETAQRRYEAALAMAQRESATTTEAAAILSGMARLYRAMDQPDKAMTYLTQALAVQSQIAPGSLRTAWVLHQMGQTAFNQSRLDEAQVFHEQALEIRQSLAPGTSREAQSLHGLGRVFLEQGQHAKASEYLCGATNILDRQATVAADNQQDRAQYRAQYTDYYRDCIDAQVQNNKINAAFNTLEQSRAQFLRTLIAERDLDFSSDLPATLDQAYRRNRAQLEVALSRLTGIGPEEHERRESARRQLAELDQERRRLLAQIKAAAPRIGVLQDPDPVDVSSLKDAVDAGTLVLSFSVGSDRTILFAYDANQDQLSHYIVPITRKQLAGQVERLRAAIEGRHHPDFRLVESDASSLAKTLLGPVSNLMAGANRLLVCPDGPLHELPFSALVLSSGEHNSDYQYLVEQKPVHRAFSVSLYRQFNRQASGVADWEKEFLAFGDPEFESIDEATAPDSRSSATALPALPFTRREVEGVASLYADQAQVFLGAEATEAQVKSTAMRAPLLHLASHAVVDDYLPLNSAVLFTPSGRSGDNGYLTALEVFEGMRIQAKLVALSACETGLGRDLGNEGMLGLVSAFQFAGAESVLASLWKVSDQGTADLMRQFYGGLKAGLAKDEALRIAQLSMLGQANLLGPQASQLRAIGGLVQADYAAYSREPFFWAAFELFGQWR